MRQIDQAEPLHPLGEPTNRKPDTGLTPIAGRPNWYQPRSGEPVYIEPPKSPKAPVVPQPWAPEFWQRAMKP